jgi:hypothetical protein
MNSTYQLLFRINFYHSYFTNGKFTNFQLKPDQLTENIFKNYDLILRREVNGIAIFFAEQFADNARSRDQILSDNLFFNFKISLGDANFFNYTDYMPSVIEDNLFYFKYPFSFTPSQIGLMHSQACVTETDLKNNLTLEQPYFSKPFGHIEITTDVNIPTDLKIQFFSPSLFWRYIIYKSHLLEFEGLAVANKNKSIFFSGPQTIVLPNGNSAIAFTSPTTIQYKEHPEVNWQLLEQYKQGESLGRVVMPSLPVPKNNQVSFLGKEYSIENQKRVLEIFI